MTDQPLLGLLNLEFIEKKEVSSGSILFNNLNGDNERYLLLLNIQATASQGQYISLGVNGQGTINGTSYSFAGNGDFGGVNERGGGLFLAKVPNNTSNIVIGGFLLIDFRTNIYYKHGVGLFSAIGGAGTGGFFSILNGTAVSGMTSLQINGGNGITGSIELYRIIS